MTSELFAQLIVSDAVVNRIREYRAKLPELDRLREAAPDPSEGGEAMWKWQEKCRAITNIKSGLPVLMYQATFDKTVSKKGYEGYWRKQSAARLNGLFMLDVDHIGASPDPSALDLRSLATIGTQEGGGELPNMRLSPRELYAKIRQEHPELFSSPQGEAVAGSIVLVHVTPSGRGLRIVAIADSAIGNIAANQAHLSELLGVEPDKACKDASRASFCPGFEDLLYSNKDKLFTYENKKYDEKYGKIYRGEAYPQSKAYPQPLPRGGELEKVRKEAYPQPLPKGREPEKSEHGDGSNHNSCVPAVASDQRSSAQFSTLNSQLAYHGKKLEEICQKWFELVCKGVPTTGDRHQSLYRLACDLRYITDFDPQLLARVLAECEVGRAIATERGTDEIQRIAADACALQRYRTMPKRMQNVLAAVGIQLADTGADPASRKAATIDYEAWWHRLEPLLSDAPGYREAVSQLPEHHRLAGVLVAGAMLGTYLSRCWWEHFDGKDYRLSFLVYVVGSAASGKSFIVDLDRLIMAPMLAADRVGREWERQYKEEMKKRAASSKNAKAEAPEQQHPVIRYLPSTISNAMLYRRLTDAIDRQAFDPTGQPLHLHCYTCEPELATALRAQTGSWAGKLDLELKSFHNEYAGVDYANDQSVNGVIQINWNQVVSGTQEAMSRKIKPSTVLDGLVTRFALFPMPQNDFAMIERRHAVRDHEREAYLRSIGLKLEQVQGELKCDRLVDFCYEYEKKLAEEARLEQDLCLDYFRKRIPVIMMRYTLVRMVLRSLSPQGPSLTPDPSPKGEGSEKLEKDESNHNSCVPLVASDQRSSAQFSILHSQLSRRQTRVLWSRGDMPARCWSDKNSWALP